MSERTYMTVLERARKFIELSKKSDAMQKDGIVKDMEALLRVAEAAEQVSKLHPFNRHPWLENLREALQALTTPEAGT